MLVTRTINNLEIKSPSSEHGTISNNLAYAVVDVPFKVYMADAVCGGKLYHFCSMWGDVCSIAITLQIIQIGRCSILHLKYCRLYLYYLIRLGYTLCRWLCVDVLKERVATQKPWQISWCGWCEHHKWMEQIKSSKSDGAMSVTKYPVFGRCAIKIILGCHFASSRLVGAL